MDNKKYIYLGRTVTLPEFKFDKGGVYFGDKIDELKEKYPLLDKLLIPVDELPNYEINEVLIKKLSEELIERGNN